MTDISGVSTAGFGPARAICTAFQVIFFDAWATMADGYSVTINYTVLPRVMGCPNRDVFPRVMVGPSRTLLPLVMVGPGRTLFPRVMGGPHRTLLSLVMGWALTVPFFLWLW